MQPRVANELVPLVGVFVGPHLAAQHKQGDGLAVRVVELFDDRGLPARPLLVHDAMADAGDVLPACGADVLAISGADHAVRRPQRDGLADCPEETTRLVVVAALAAVAQCPCPLTQGRADRDAGVELVHLHGPPVDLVV